MDIIEKAILVFGISRQMDLAIENMAELSDEILKYKKGQSVHEELAAKIIDVEILVRQLKKIIEPYLSQGLLGEIEKKKIEELEKLTGMKHEEFLNSD